MTSATTIDSLRRRHYALEALPETVRVPALGERRHEEVKPTEDATVDDIAFAMRRPIVNNSERGDRVYEPFCGSGTTLIAAETVGRVCLAMELDPAYCDVIVRRWQEFSGKVAVLDGDGRAFDELVAERKP